MLKMILMIILINSGTLLLRHLRQLPPCESDQGRQSPHRSKVMTMIMVIVMMLAIMIMAIIMIKMFIRCGSEFPLEDGSPSECDGASGNHCCSLHGYHQNHHHRNHHHHPNHHYREINQIIIISQSSSKSPPLFSGIAALALTTVPALGSNDFFCAG